MFSRLLKVDDRGARDGLNTVASVATIAWLAVTVVGGIIAFLTDRGALALNAGAFALGVASAMLLFALRVFIPVRQRPLPKRLFTTRKETMTYVFEEEAPAKQSYASTFTIAALEPGVETCERRMRWSGSGIVHPASVDGNNNCALLGPVPKEHYDCYYVHFGRALAVGEPRSITIRQQFEDPDCTMSTFVQKRVREEMDELHLEVRFSGKLMPCPGSTYLMETEADYPYTTLSCQQGEFESDGRTIQFRPAAPMVGHLYSIVWEW